MILITDKPNHPSILSHKSKGYMKFASGEIVPFDELLYFEESLEWPAEEAPYYFVWRKADNYRCGYPVNDVTAIYFTDDRISEASI
jgi:hypothetical protein